jgi:hemolysin activation/secretion protein
VDGGRVQVIDPITATDRYTLAGAGLGLRLKAWGGVSAALDWALALKELNNTRRHDSRVYFRLAYEF